MPIKNRKHKPMLLVDLAIPRDIEVEISKLDDIFLYTFDDLAKLAQEGVKNRKNEIIEGRKSTEIDVGLAFSLSLFSPSTSSPLPD